MNGQLPWADALASVRIVHQLLGQRCRFGVGNEPPDDIAAEDVEHHVQVEVGPLGRTPQLGDVPPVSASPSTNLELLTVEDVSVACHVAAATVRAWLRRGKLIGKKVGRGYLVERSALNRFLAAIIPALKDGDGAESEIERILQRARGR